MALRLSIYQNKYLTLYLFQAGNRSERLKVAIIVIIPVIISLIVVILMCYYLRRRGKKLQKVESKLISTCLLCLPYDYMSTALGNGTGLHKLLII